MCVCGWQIGTPELKEDRKTELVLMLLLFSPQDPNADTEWNDILRKKGILPPKEEPKDDEEEELALKQQSVGKKDGQGSFLHATYHPKYFVFLKVLTVF